MRPENLEPPGSPKLSGLAEAVLHPCPATPVREGSFTLPRCRRRPRERQIPLIIMFFLLKLCPCPHHCLQTTNQGRVTVWLKQENTSLYFRRKEHTYQTNCSTYWQKPREHTWEWILKMPEQTRQNIQWKKGEFINKGALSCDVKSGGVWVPLQGTCHSFHAI